MRIYRANTLHFEWDRETKTLVVYKIHKPKQSETDPRCMAFDMEVLEKYKDVASGLILKETNKQKGNER